jgi:hypothetical protein
VTKSLGSVVTKARNAVSKVQESLDDKLEKLYTHPETPTATATDIREPVVKARTKSATDWTLLDRAAGNSICLVGLPDGRVSLVMAMSGGPWKDTDFKRATEVASSMSMSTVVYRHTYEDARKVKIRFTGGEWFTGGAEATKPDQVGRPTPALHMESYEAQLRMLAAEALDGFKVGEDPASRARVVGDLLVAVAKHSFNRGWKEIGFGFWG